MIPDAPIQARERRTIWIVSGGAEAVPGIERAKAMGLRVVVSDGSGEAPGLALADHPVIVSTYDADATLAAARDFRQRHGPIDGVLCIAADVPLTVATVAAGLGLPGIPVPAAQLAMDKLAMKRRLVEAGIPVPWFAPVRSVAELQTLLAERGPHLVLKPVDSRGARGVLRLSAGTDPDWAFHHARSVSPSARVMVEAYLPGPQVSTEALLIDGTGHTVGFADRNYEHLERYAPYVIENGGEQPSALEPDVCQAIAGLAIRAGRALGIETGVVKGDMVLTEQGPAVIEIAARLSGGWFSTTQIPLASGVDLIGAAIRVALGERPEAADLAIRQGRPAVAIRYFFPSPGRVRAIEGIEAVRTLPWVHRLGFFVSAGEVLAPVTDHTRRAGYVITTGDSRDEAVARAREIVESRIRIRTEPA